ncbi:MAG: hypothetical protein Q9220_004917 [cf. Caloplaca sp. 1 TL-2023]
MASSYHHDPSSSVNSAEVDSHRGTPDTKLTNLSPEDLRTDRSSVVNQGTLRSSQQPPPFTLGPVPAKGTFKAKAPAPAPASATLQDPFVTSKPGLPATCITEPLKLSPAAPAFTPLGQIGSASDDIVSRTLTVPQLSPGEKLGYPSRENGAFLFGLPYIPPRRFRSSVGWAVDRLLLSGTVCIEFTDIRDSIDAVAALHGLHRDWTICYLPASRKASGGEHDDCTASLASKYEGQLLVKAEFSGPSVYFDIDTVGRLVLDLLNNYGGIMAYDTVGSMHPVVAYRAEFYDIKDADHAVAHLNGFRIAGCTMVIQRSPILTSDRPSSMDPPTKSHQYMRDHSRHSGRNGQDYSGGHHNIVDVDRICKGADIMLRNIPNKIDQAMLKDIVDETSRGRYDFMYLRIDFANNCNVGYAFINFEDPYFIIEFVNARAGHRWWESINPYISARATLSLRRNRFNSDKVAEVSYATIQGKDCLVQKFRNSSVMLEHPSFRPKIFRVGDGPLGGTEERFPGPDNPSKMRRSVENAEHVGEETSQASPSRLG